jgi:DHA1 family inner membrane transport protein
VSSTVPPDDVPALSTLRVVVAVVALALGGFAIGTTEFVTMGVLPDIAAGVGVDIPSAGHVISVYALGVVVGAPVIAALSARLPRRALLVGLMTAFFVANLLTAVAPGYRTLLVARFLSGLPHGAYFGVASLVAASLVAPHLRGRRSAPSSSASPRPCSPGRPRPPGSASSSAGGRPTGWSPSWPP